MWYAGISWLDTDNYDKAYLECNDEFYCGSRADAFSMMVCKIIPNLLIAADAELIKIFNINNLCIRQFKNADSNIWSECIIIMHPNLDILQEFTIFAYEFAKLDIDLFDLFVDLGNFYMRN
jgi:hypothetical protein